MKNHFQKHVFSHYVVCQEEAFSISAEVIASATLIDEGNVVCLEKSPRISWNWNIFEMAEWIYRQLKIKCLFWKTCIKITEWKVKTKDIYMYKLLNIPRVYKQVGDGQPSALSKYVLQKMLNASTLVFRNQV